MLANLIDDVDLGMPISIFEVEMLSTHPNEAVSSPFNMGLKVKLSIRKLDILNFPLFKLIHITSILNLIQLTFHVLGFVVIFRVFKPQHLTTLIPLRMSSRLTPSRSLP